MLTLLLLLNVVDSEDSPLPPEHTVEHFGVFVGDAACIGSLLDGHLLIVDELDEPDSPLVGDELVPPRGLCFGSRRVRGHPCMGFLIEVGFCHGVYIY